jgi:hypothetical protein
MGDTPLNGLDLQSIHDSSPSDQIPVISAALLEPEEILL